MPPLPSIPPSMPTPSEPRLAARWRATTSEPTSPAASATGRDFARDLSNAQRPRPAPHADTATTKPPATRKPLEQSAAQSTIEPTLEEDVTAESTAASATANIANPSPVPTSQPAQCPHATTSAATQIAAMHDAIPAPGTSHVASTTAPNPAAPPPSSDSLAQTTMFVSTAASPLELDQGDMGTTTLDDISAATGCQATTAGESVTGAATTVPVSTNGRSQTAIACASADAAVAAASGLLAPVIAVPGHGEGSARQQQTHMHRGINTRRSSSAEFASDEPAGTRDQPVNPAARAEPTAPASTIPAAARAMQVERGILIDNAAAQAAPPPTDLNNALSGSAAATTKVASPRGPTETGSATFQLPLADDAPLAALTGQAMRGLSAMVNQRGGSMTLRLDPPDLGDLRIRMTISRGVVTAEFQAGLQHTQSLLDRGLAALRQSLEAQGLTVERLTVHAAPSHVNAPQQSSLSRDDSSAQQQSSSQHDAGGSESRGRREHPPGSHQQSWLAWEFDADGLTFESLLGQGAAQHFALASGGSRT